MRSVPLEDLAQINPRPPKIPGNQEVSFVGMAELDAVNARTESDAIRQYCEVSKGYTVFENGDILVAKITPCFENNKIGQAQLQCEIGVGSTEFHVVRVGAELDARYLLHFLRQDFVRRQGEIRMTGSAGQRRVPADFLRQLKVPLPPIEEQRRLSAVFDQAEHLRRNHVEVAERYSDLLASLRARGFSGEL